MKKIKTILKIQIDAGKANPAPPIGTALGPQGVNIQEFCKQFNDATKEMIGDVVPAEITVYEDRSFTFIMKIAPVAELIKKAAKIQKGSGKPLQEKVGKITKAQVREIAEKKMPDLNARTLEAAMSMVEGTAKQMGVVVE